MKCYLLLVIFICAFGSTGYAQSYSYNNVTFSFKLTDGINEESKTNFRLGDEVVIRPIITNSSTELFPFVVTDNRYLYKFTLTKIGQVLPIAYRSDKAHILSIREETESGGNILAPDPIFPGNIQKLETMKLSDRYENLTVGTYKLSIEYKTSKEIQINGVSKLLRLTSEVAFEIVP